MRTPTCVSRWSSPRPAARPGGGRGPGGGRQGRQCRRREQAVFALGQIRDRRAVEPLISALKDAVPDVRQQAAFGLGQIRDRSAVDALMVAVKDANKDVREQVVFALGQIRDRRDRRVDRGAQGSERRRPQASGLRPRTTRSITSDARPGGPVRPPGATLWFVMLVF